MSRCCLRIMAALFLVPAALVAFASSLSASPGGRAGLAQSATGCSCHSALPNQSGAMTVQITGPQQLVPGASGSYTISVSGLPSGTNGGFDLKATGGTFTPGANNKILSGDLVHSNNSARSWSFSWQAPAVEGGHSFYAVGMSANGSGTGGDSWNWYGGAVNTAFAIAVSTTGVDGSRPGLWLAPPSPNPARGVARLSYSLAAATEVRLEILDACGRRMARLVDGIEAAGRHEVAWRGTDERGGVAPGGIYFVRLSSGGETRRSRIVLER